MKPRTLGYLCFAFISLLWGTTYLVAHIGVKHFPAFLFTGARQLTAGLILLAILKVAKVPFNWNWKNIYPQLIAGTLIVTLGNGLVTLAVRYIPSGLCALLCTLIPMNMILISLFLEKGQKMNRFIWTGLLFGLAGMACIFRDNLADLGKAEYLGGILLTIVATICWSAGSVYSKTVKISVHSMYKAALQMAAGGIVLLVISAVGENWEAVQSPDRSTMLAWLYLTLLGSVAAFAAYQYALQVLPSGFVSTYAYINPLIAVLLGKMVLDERLTWYTALAFALTAIGVYTVTRGYKYKPVKNAAITIEDYRPEWKHHFEQLNKAWLEEYYTVEPVDKWVLENPEEAILEKGGKILFAVQNGQVIGTVAIRPAGNNCYELTKMAVHKENQGQGAGKLLCNGAIEMAASLGAQKIVLFSQSRLLPALHIYRQLGFRDIPLETGIYARADVKMELILPHTPQTIICSREEAYVTDINSSFSNQKI